MRRASGALLLVFVVSVFVTPAVAEPIEVPGTAWLLGGVSRLKVKKVGKFGQSTFGQIDFKQNDRFVLVLEEFFTLSGAYECRRRRCLLTPDPVSLEKALVSLLEGTVFGFALRGVAPGNVKFKVKLKTKKGTEFVKVRLRIVFDALLALDAENPDDPAAELIEPFRMKYRYKGTSPFGQ